jgi:hypothetical protein
MDDDLHDGRAADRFTLHCKDMLDSARRGASFDVVVTRIELPDLAALRTVGRVGADCGG